MEHHNKRNIGNSIVDVFCIEAYPVMLILASLLDKSLT